MSRLFDVWSLGCVFFETLVQILYGNQWLQDFDITTKQGKDNRENNQTPFWIRDGDWAAVSPNVSDCIQHMIDKDPECRTNGPSLSALARLLDLIQTKMLVVELPEDTEIYETGKRANTNVILDDLDGIIEEALNDPSYLFTGKDRSNLLPLPSPRRLNPSADTKPKQFLAVPGQSNREKSITRYLNTYSGRPDSSWKYENDDLFALAVFQRARGAYSTICFPPLRQSLCKFCEVLCQDLDVLKNAAPSSRKVQELDDTCVFCTMLLTRANLAGLKQETSMSIKKGDATLTISSVEDAVTLTWELRLCHGLGDPISQERQMPLIPMGLPKIPVLENEICWNLLRSWLDDCNSGHGNKAFACMAPHGKVYLPKRLLDVGTGEEPASKIVETKNLPGADKVQYLASSHPWGKKTVDNPHFVSTVDNISRHMAKILDHDLPATFRDMVLATRQLGVRYLWIDALCILQATDKDPGDFKDEASLMEDIFTSAYCVLAASSATEMASGFLQSGSATSRRNRHAVTGGSSETNRTLYICDTPDDFQRDVMDSHLSTRGWVFQERALARRTIFFTNNQVYWECSGGFRCESMTKFVNAEAALLGDSKFPVYAVKGKTKGARIHFFQSLYANYCRLSLGWATDKPFAISGLEQRFTQQLEDQSGAGVFGEFIGRGLLWRRPDNVDKLERINFDVPKYKSHNAHPPPSWSFMAHTGEISYIDVPGHTVTWEDLDLHLTGSAQGSWLYAKDPPVFHAQAHNFKLNANSFMGKWLAAYDNPNAAKMHDRCLIIGKTADALSYILIVRPKSSSSHVGAVYERVGVGYIPGSWISNDRIPVEIV